MRTEVIQQKPKRASAQPLLDNSLMIFLGRASTAFDEIRDLAREPFHSTEEAQDELWREEEDELERREVLFGFRDDSGHRWRRI